MEAAQADIVAKHGCIVREAFELANDDGTPLDTTGWTAAAQVRKRVGAELTADFIAEVEDGVLLIEMELEVSNAIAAGQYVWDAILTNADGEPDQYFKGSYTKVLTATVLP